MTLELVVVALVALAVGIGIGREIERKRVLRMKVALNAMYGAFSENPPSKRFVGETPEAYVRRLRSFYHAGPS